MFVVLPVAATAVLYKYRRSRQPLDFRFNFFFFSIISWQKLFETPSSSSFTYNNIFRPTSQHNSLFSGFPCVYAI